MSPIICPSTSDSARPVSAAMRGFHALTQPDASNAATPSSVECTRAARIRSDSLRAAFSCASSSTSTASCRVISRERCATWIIQPSSTATSSPHTSATVDTTDDPSASVSSVGTIVSTQRRPIAEKGTATCQGSAGAGWGCHRWNNITSPSWMPNA
jgi:hypothetical protein